MQLLKEKRTPVFPLFVLLTLGIQAIVAFAMLLQLFFMARLSSKPVPTLVQLLDGKAITVAPVERFERTPDTIKSFISQTMSLMFSWSGTLAPSNAEELRNPKQDPGVVAGSQQNNKIASATWESGFALSEKFRQPFLEKLAELTPQEIFRSRETQGALIIRLIGEPQKLEQGKWKISLISNIVFFSNQNQIGRSIPFNKEIYLMAVESPTLPLAEKSSSLQQVIYRIRQAGLEIYAIRDLPKEDL
jgi:hypothetical protein